MEKSEYQEVVVDFWIMWVIQKILLDYQNV